MADDKKNIPETAPPAEAPAPTVENVAVPEPPAPDPVLTDAEAVMLEQEGHAALFEMGDAVPDPADTVTLAEVEEPAAPEAPKAEKEQEQPPAPGKDDPAPAHSGKVVDFAAAHDEAAKEEKKAVKQKPPTEKDKDGYLGVIPHGSTEPKKITDVDTLDAPKGLLYQDGFLYCTDVDMVYKIDAKTGTIEGYVDLSPSRMKFLNDLAFINGRLMVSSTDTDQIFYVDTNTSSYGELITKQPIYKPNGLAWDPERKVIYLCEYATDEKGKPSGRLLSINPVSREVTELSKERGQYGLVYRDNALYYSDWSKDKKPEAIRRLDLKTGRSAPAATGPIEGAADFILYDSMIVVPGMAEKKIHIMPIGGKK